MDDGGMSERSSKVEKVGAELNTLTLPPLTHEQNTPSVDGKQQSKLDDVLRACKAGDLDKLKGLSVTAGGFITDEARRLAWPLLLGCAASGQAGRLIPTWESLDRHRDEEQVTLDVNRAFVYYPRGETETRILERKEELQMTITEVLRRHPYLCYFQGYHDIVQVLLLVLGAKDAVPAVERLSVLRIRDFMLPTMKGTIPHLSLIAAVLRAADHELYMHLSHSAPFYFALSATLTLYAHEIQEYGDISRLFDFLLAHESVISIYLFTIIICTRRKQLLELEADEQAMLHSILSKLPNPLDLDSLVAQAADLYQKNPPERLGGFVWYNISSNSVLKTTHHPGQLKSQSLADGKVFFDRQADELKRQEVRTQQLVHLRRLAMRYRRPAIVTGTAIFVALLAAYVRKPSSSLHVVVPEWGSRALLALREVLDR